MEDPAREFPAWLKEHCTRLRGRDAELRNLNLNIRRLDVRMMVFLASALRENDLLVILNLTSSLSADPSALIPLTQMVLPHHQSLKSLHLSYNRIQDVTALGTALTTNRHLEEIHLDYNRIDAQGAQSLAEGLRHNQTLRVLCLNYNLVGDAGCQALASALRTNTTLQELALKHNGISALGATALQTSLRVNSTIRAIHLDMNEISTTQDEDNVVAHIQIVCRANAAGRAFLLSNHGNAANQHGVWPAFLERLKADPDLLYFFLRTKPDICLLPPHYT